jgi:RHS repeat-associated protein
MRKASGIAGAKARVGSQAVTVHALLHIAPTSESAYTVPASATRPLDITKGYVQPGQGPRRRASHGPPTASEHARRAERLRTHARGIAQRVERISPLCRPPAPRARGEAAKPRDSAATPSSLFCARETRMERERKTRYASGVGASKQVIERMSARPVRKTRVRNFRDVRTARVRGLSSVTMRTRLGKLGACCKIASGQVRARDYDPAAGRFISKDASRWRGGIRGGDSLTEAWSVNQHIETDTGLNFYLYAEGDPVNLIDQEGAAPGTPDGGNPAGASDPSAGDGGVCSSDAEPAIYRDPCRHWYEICLERAAKTYEFCMSSGVVDEVTCQSFRRQSYGQCVQQINKECAL